MLPKYKVTLSVRRICTDRAVCKIGRCPSYHFSDSRLQIRSLQASFLAVELSPLLTEGAFNKLHFADTNVGMLHYKISMAVSGQFRCARYKCGISACKQSNLCCYDGFCTNLCCTNDIVILTGP